MVECARVPIENAMHRHFLIAILAVYLLIFYAQHLFNWSGVDEEEREKRVIRRFKTRKEKLDLFVSSAYSLDLLEDGAEYTIRLIALGPQPAKWPEFYCVNQFDERVKAQISPMGGVPSCRFWNHHIDCQFSSPSSRIRLTDQKNRNEIELPIRHPNRKRFGLVVCFARMFSFDNWRVALTAIEMYRFHDVDFFHIPIISVLKELHVILKHYERLGIVNLADGVVLSKESKQNDPNHDVEFFNQIVSNTECLYEYRHSDFIIFSDFDDVLIPRHFKSIYEEMSWLASRFPLAASFEFYRNPGTAIRYAKNPRDFNLTDSLSHISFDNLTPIVPGKSVAIPRRIRQGIMHRPDVNLDLLRGYKHVRLDTNESMVLHLRNYIFERNWSLPMDAYVNEIDYSGVHLDFVRRIKSNSKVENAFNHLPVNNVWFDSMSECYLDIGLQLHRNQTFCPNPLDCQLPRPQHLPSCIRQLSKYEKKQLDSTLVVHRRTEIRYLATTDCFF